MSDRSRRLVLIVLGAVIAWYVAVVVIAARPSTDAVPIGNIPNWEASVAGSSTSVAPEVVPQGQAKVQDVECNAVFESGARDGTLPSLPFPQQFNREPCTLLHDNARVVFGLNTGVVVLLLAAGAVLLARSRRRGGASPDVPQRREPATTAGSVGG